MGFILGWGEGGGGYGNLRLGLLDLVLPLLGVVLLCKMNIFLSKGSGIEGLSGITPPKLPLSAPTRSLTHEPDSNQ